MTLGNLKCDRHNKRKSTKKLEDKDQDISHILYKRDKKKIYKNQRGYAEVQDLTNSNSRKGTERKLLNFNIRLSIKNLNFQPKKAHQVLSIWKEKETQRGHVIIKFQNLKDESNILRASGEIVALEDR